MTRSDEAGIALPFYLRESHRNDFRRNFHSECVQMDVADVRAENVTVLLIAPQTAYAHNVCSLERERENRAKEGRAAQREEEEEEGAEGAEEE